MSCSKPSVTTFQSNYILEFPWVKENPNSRSSAICTWCTKIIDVTSMGKRALSSHAKSAKHQSHKKNRENCLRLEMFCKSKGNEPTCQGPSTSSATQEKAPPPPETNFQQQVPRPQPPVLQRFLVAEMVTTSENYWCLQAVVNHLSFRTTATLAAGFPKQFPDSDIASKVKLQRTKVSYTIVFGLAPYFHKQLKETVKNATYIVLCFDESFNSVSQKEQLDLHVRFCNGNKIETRYYTSVFLGHTKASDLLGAITSTFSDSDLRKVIQVSMDGPNVNLKMLTDLQLHLTNESPDVPQLLNIGTCGLHTIHNAFKVAIISTGWEIMAFLRALHNLFKNSPARRSDYTHLSKSTIFPLKFCAVRWVESGPVAERAQKILPNIITYVNDIAKQPTSHSFKVVKDKVKDNLLPAKLAFFASLASLVEPFLREFQGDKPMAPFIYQEIQMLLLTLLKRVIKPEVVQKASGSLEKIDTNKTENLIAAKHIDLGFATKDAIRTAKSKSSDIDILHLKTDCRAAILKMVGKLLERSPLKYNFTKYISCLDPSVIGHSFKDASTRLTKCLEVLVAKKWMSGVKADVIKRDYNELFSSPGVNELCKNFRRNITRLDDFFFQSIIVEFSDHQDKYKQLQEFVLLVLTLSHGNATVERGFSVNSECIVENLRDESLVALRQVYDGALAMGDINSMEISKEMVHSARNAHSRYLESLKKKQDQQNEDINLKNLKRKEALEKKELEAKKAKIIADVEEAKRQAALLDDRISQLTRQK